MLASLREELIGDSASSAEDFDLPLLAAERGHATVPVSGSAAPMCHNACWRRELVYATTSRLSASADT
jgi:hypothetical protein